MKKPLPIYGAYILSALIVVISIAALYQSTRTKQQAPEPSAAPAPLAYSKGNVSFLYPWNWKTNDMPAPSGFMTVQLSDPEDFIVFVASSAKTFNDIKTKAKPQYQKDTALDGVKGTQRLWEDDKTQTATFRADHFEFQKRFYRFEMFTSRSRQVKADSIWKDILSSVQFATSTQDAIQALPKK